MSTLTIKQSHLSNHSSQSGLSKQSHQFHALSQLIRTICLGLVKFYQLALAPFKRNRSCGYVPSCSEYTIEAIEKFGVRSGLKLSLNRISRCHPFYPCGFDPVPETLEMRTN